MSNARETALDLIDFLDASPSPYHAVDEALRRLTAAGFTEVAQAEDWPSGHGRHVVTEAGRCSPGWSPEGPAGRLLPAAWRAYRQPDAAGEAAPRHR